MKNLIFFIFTFIVLVSLFSCKSEKEKLAERQAIIDSTLVNFQKTYYENQLDSVFAKHHFNGSIAVFKDSMLIYEKENGFEDFKTKEKLDHNSVFAIGSLSKQFTAVLILLQEEAGKLKTTDKVAQYLTEFQNSEYENITIHQLLNHTSGINDYGNQLLFKSGTDFNYSNKGYRFLGKLIEKVSGKTYTENAEEVFKKLGMNSTFTAENFNENDFAGAFIGNAKTPHKVEGMPERLTDGDIGIPAGGILSTIHDLKIWNLALFDGKILQAKSLKKFMEKSAERNHPIFGKVGYCYGIMTNIAEPKSHFHTGYVKGSPSLNIYYPETKTSVIILSNLASESHGIEPIFIPHNEVKAAIDAIEIAMKKLREKMIK